MPPPFAWSRAALLMLALLPQSAFAGPDPKWTPIGPSPNTRGQVEGIANGEVAGTINAVAPHPTDANVAYVGSVNGGVWRTRNAMAASPAWEQQTDGKASLSIGALEFDPTDATGQTLVAGTGRFSSMGRSGGARAGLLRTTDGGANWTALDGGGTLLGLNVSGVAARGATLVISVNAADDSAKVGVWRSINTGGAWSKVSGGAGTGLPNGRSFGLAADPGNRDRLFTNAGSGLYRSNNAGANWSKVSNPAMDALIAGAGNVKVAVGAGDIVYVAIVRDGVVADIFRSGNGGTSWAAMGAPTAAGAVAHPGGQGEIHLSIAADPGDTNLVYVGGDRQDGPFPNPIGARDYSGCLFRGNASKPAGERWVHLTHSKTLGPAGGGTAAGSAPHADSRGLRFAANGVLLEADDGGVYRRTSPRTNAGDWFSMNGNLQVAEFHSVAWDANARVVIGGAQDTGTPEQQLPSDPRWRSVSTGDGGVVAVDVLSSSGLSTRYSSAQHLRGFRRRVYDASNVLQSQVFPPLTVIDGGDQWVAQFYTPIRLNAVAPKRLVIGAGNSLYESLDKGDTVTEVGPGIRTTPSARNPIAYGAAGNEDVLYVGAGANVFVRTAASPAAPERSAAYAGGAVLGVVLDPADHKTAYVIDAGRVWRTTDAGGAWADVTGNLASLKPGTLRSVAYSTASPGGALVVGGDAGVFTAAGSTFSNWAALGTGLPRAPVLHLEYHPAGKLLLAGTLGRGAWTMALQPLPPVATRTLAKEAPGVTAAAPPKSPDSGESNGVLLYPGVVVDPGRKRLYVMNPEGGIDAVGFGRGERVWHTEAAAKPLALVAGRLLGQAEFSGAGSGVRIVSLDLAAPDRVVSGTMTLPAGVTPTINETARGEFVARVRASEGDPLLSWQFFERPKRGVAPGTVDAPLPAGAAERPAGVSAPQDRIGTFRVNPLTGRVNAVEGADVVIRRRPLAAQADGPGRLPGIGDRQFLSADRRHVLVSKQTGDEKVWDKYTLTVYDRSTGKRVGKFESHLSLVPFHVEGSRVLYVTGAYSRRTAAGLVEEPLKVRAVDLPTGKDVWNRRVRDTSYHGPFPP